MIPLLVFSMVITGALTRAIYGWLDSGEAFVKRKFVATMIFTFFTVALPATTAVFASNMIVDTAGVIGFCVTALLAGWGADSGLKELTKMKDLNGAPK